MNKNRGIKRAVRSLKFFLGFWLLFCLIKIIQYLPSEAESILFDQRIQYWRAMKETCELLDKSLRLDCVLNRGVGLTKDLHSFLSPSGEWLLIGAITLYVIAELVYILNGFLDD